MKKVAADVNAVKDSTGIEAVAITKGKISGVSAAGKVSFDLAGNHTNGQAAKTYDVTATLAATSDLDPLVDAINAHAANTGITAVLGSAASEIILTHQTGETIEINGLQVGGTTDGTMVLTALDKFGNDVTTKDTTLSRAANSATAVITLGNQATTGVKARGHVLGQMTLNSIKSFTVTGDDATAEQGLFHTAQSIPVKLLVVVLHS